MLLCLFLGLIVTEFQGQAHDFFPSSGAPVSKSPASTYDTVEYRKIREMERRMRKALSFVLHRNYGRGNTTADLLQDLENHHYEIVLQVDRKAILKIEREMVSSGMLHYFYDMSHVFQDSEGLYPPHQFDHYPLAMGPRHYLKTELASSQDPRLRDIYMFHEMIGASSPTVINDYLLNLSVENLTKNVEVMTFCSIWLWPCLCRVAHFGEKEGAYFYIDGIRYLQTSATTVTPVEHDLFGNLYAMPETLPSSIAVNGRKLEVTGVGKHLMERKRLIMMQIYNYQKSGQEPLPTRERVQLLQETGHSMKKLNQPEKALDCYLQALALVDKPAMDSEPSLCMNMWMETASLYGQLGNTVDSQVAWERALAYAKHIGDAESLYQISHDYGRLLSDMGKHRESEACIEPFFRQAIHAGSKAAFRLGALHVENAIALADYPEAVRIIECLTSFTEGERSGEQTDILNLYMGRTWLGRQELLSAEQCFRKVLESNSSEKLTSAACNGLMQVFSLQQRQHADSVRKYQALASVSLPEEALHKKRSLFYYEVAGLILLGLGTVLFFPRISANLHKRKMGGQQGMFAGNNNEKINRRTALLHSDIVVRFRDALTHFKDNPLCEQDWNTLATEAEAAFPLLASEFLGERKLNVNEYRICLLVLSGFDPAEIDVLIGKGRGYSSTLRKRMNLKLFGKDSGASDFDKSFINYLIS